LLYARAVAGVDYAAIFERSANPYAVIDRELRCVAANAAFCWVFYRSREDLVGASLMAVFAQDPEAQRARLRATIEGVLETGRTAVLASAPGRELDLRDRATGRSWGATYVPLRDAAGQVAFVLWHHGPLEHEASEREDRARERAELADARRAAHGQIERAHALIEYAVAQRRALQPLRSALQRAAAALDTGEPASGGPGALADLCCAARRVVMTMMALGSAIDIVTGTFSIDVALVDIAAVARAAADLARHGAGRRGVALDVEIDSPAAVRGSASPLQTAVEALLVFALERTPAGGRVTLRVGSRGGATEIAIEMTSTDGTLAAAWVPGVFARLVPSGGGAGLPWLEGSVARYVVEAHGGELVAAGSGGTSGATVTVRLPASAERSGPTGLRVNTSQHLVPAMLEGLRVLVVGDDAGVSASLCGPLERCQAQVTSVTTQGEAMRRFEQQPPDVVLDVRWSDDGNELLRRIRELPDDHGGLTPVIALSPGELAGVPPRDAGARRTTRGEPVEPVQWLERVTTAASEPSATNERHDRHSRGPVAGVDYAAIFDASPNPYAVIDRALRYAAVNTAYCRVIGRRRDRLIDEGLLAQFGDPLEEDLAQQLRVVLEHVFATGFPAELPALPYRPFPVVEQAYRRSWRGWRAAHLPLSGANRRVELVLQHQAPIRPRPLLQELFRGEGTERIELERAVQRQTARALALVDVFPGIRVELLSAAVGLEPDPGAPPGAVGSSSADQLERVARGARSLDEAARRATDLLGVITGREPLDAEPIDLGDVVRAVAERMWCGEPRVAVDTVIQAPAAVSGHRALLSQMVRGLLESAIAVAPRGARIALRVATRSKDVELAMQGVGMNLRRERMPHLFCPLHLFDSAIETGSVAGRLARYIIEAHGGELVAESNGVAVRLPPAPRAITATEPTPGPGH
jgi:signal transduction histidine kinase/CheY-like chemotaxis protein